MVEWGSILNDTNNASEDEVNLFVDIWKTMFEIHLRSTDFEEQHCNFFPIIEKIANGKRGPALTATKLFAAFVEATDGETLHLPTQHAVASRILQTPDESPSEKTHKNALKFLLALKSSVFTELFHEIALNAPDDFVHSVVRYPVKSALYSMNYVFQEPFFPEYK
jgi:hypothetical protein